MRHKYTTLRRKLIAVQNAYRCIVARRLLKKLRAEAKDVGRLQDMNENMKKEISRLKEMAVAKHGM